MGAVQPSRVTLSPLVLGLGQVLHCYHHRVTTVIIIVINAAVITYDKIV